MSDGAQRVLTQADHDLERIMNVLDEAIMSRDPRVEECLRRLMVVVALTRPEGERGGLSQGPLRRLQQDLREVHQRISSLESQIHRMNVMLVDRGGQQYEQKFWIAPTTTMPPTQVTWTAGDPLPGSKWAQSTAVDPLTKRTL